MLSQTMIHQQIQQLKKINDDQIILNGNKLIEEFHHFFQIYLKYYLIHDILLINPLFDDCICNCKELSLINFELQTIIDEYLKYLKKILPFPIKTKLEWLVAKIISLRTYIYETYRYLNNQYENIDANMFYDEKTNRNIWNEYILTFDIIFVDSLQNSYFDVLENIISLLSKSSKNK